MTRSLRWPAVHWWFVLLLALMAGCTANAAEERRVNGFESPAELNDWQVVAGTPKLVAEGVTEGKSALEVTFDPQGEWFPVSLFWNKVIPDWSPYDALVLDVLNPNDFPIEGSVLVADKAWEDKGRSYWNRHNGGTTFAPGKGQWVIPVRGLYRGEAGSRNNDIKTDIDPTTIVRLDLNFGSKGQNGRVVIDNLRFIKMDKAQGVWAYDFGPPSQPVMMGWTPVTFSTAYSATQGYGWGPQGGTPWNGAARDTTFGTMLTQDFCEAGGYNFRVDVPPGLYDVLVVFENCGYWGGEQSRHRSRGILVNDIPVWSEQRPDGPATALYRFEDVEPVGADLWDTYMEPEITKPVRFQAQAGNEGITFQFRADVVFGCKVSALALHRADDAAAAKWVNDQWEAVKTEFRAKAVCLDAPAKPSASDKPLVVWPVTIEDEVTPSSVPDEAPRELVLTAETVRGEYEPLCVALRPTTDLGACALKLEPGADFPPTAVQVVRYNTSRGFGSLAYHVQPHTLRPAESVDLPKDITREIVVTVNVPPDAKPGTREATLKLTDARGGEVLVVPLRVTIHDVALKRDTGYLMGFFGLEPPGELLPEGAAPALLEETLKLLREHGMNAVSGGPSFTLTGWQMGVPQVDFGQCDGFFALLRKYGFTKAINGYGGLRFVGLHDGYEKGETGKKVEEQSGLDYETAVLRAWQAVDEHARANDWPLIYYAMCDETRVRDVAERELGFMRIMQKVSERFPRTVKASGAYSVDFSSRPTDEDDLKVWHQRFFDALPVSSLNGHDQSVMDEAKKLGREIHIYNQGTSRYSFGLYQWSEYQKGVAARWQWHLNVLHGYQFFDLDGREPDTAMICYGRDQIYPTIAFERCREGAEDFYLYQTLANQIAANRQANRKPTETAAAEKLLTSLTDSVAINQRNAPDGFDADKVKREVVRAIETMM
jgi:hypothetical protein